MTAPEPDPLASEHDDSDEADSAVDVEPAVTEDPGVSEDDALKALREGGTDADDAEVARAAAIAARVADRLQRDPSGTRIGSVALFNGAVNVTGGFAIGDGATPDRSAARLTRIDGRLLAEYIEFYCPPDGFGDALERLSKHRLIVLVAPPGTGREATAYNLLVEALATNTDSADMDDEDGGCFLVANDPAVATLTWGPPQRGSGYVLLLDDLPVQNAGNGAELPADGVTERWLTGLTTKVLEADSFLVLISGPARGDLVATATRLSHSIVSLPAVDPLRIVQRRVLGHEPDPAGVAELDNRLQACGARGLLCDQPQPHVAVHLAEVISRDGDLAAAVAMLRNPTRQVHQWFNSHRDVPTRCFALAAAALEDASYLTVSDAAMDLNGLLVSTQDVAFDPRFRDRLSSNHPWLEVSVLSGENDYGAMLTVPRVRFRDPLVQQAVLGYAWSYLDGFRPALQKWLRRLVTHPSVEVRARTSVAAGVIAWSDYDYAMHRYLRSWAGSQQKVLRQAAATAVDVAGTHPDLTELVWSVLESWVREANSPFGRRLALTAAMVTGGLMGSQAPERAMAVLRGALERPDWAALVPVGHSVLRLIEHGRIDEVLTGLLDWSGAQDASDLVTKALSVFVFVTCQPAPDGGDPILFAEAGSRSRRRKLVELWTRALARKPAQTQALDALRELLDVYGNQAGPVMVELPEVMLGIATRPGEHRRRLEWYLDRWARDDGNPSAPAARLRAVIRRMA